MTEARELYEKVLKNNYCIGCGACSLVNDSPFDIRNNEYGNIIAVPNGDIDKSKAGVLEVCPFSDRSKNEDELSDLFFPSISDKDHRIGKYIDCYAGYVNEGIFREKGSSGGLGKWLGYILLKENKIDFLIQVVPNLTGDPSNPLFDYAVISEKDDVLAGSSSAYYPVNLVNVIETIRKTEGRYAITGVPCFIKAIRLLSLNDNIINSRVRYTIGLICGGMKSANQAKMIGWQLGIIPKNLVSIDFRRKYPDKPASRKIYQVWSNLDEKERFRDSYDIYGTDFGAGYFKPKACDYCDDVVSETADISIGDAWLPKFVNDPKGTTITIIRNREISEIIARHMELGDLKLHSITAEDVATSQAAGLRHRREALSYRIGKQELSKVWYPPKRVKPNEYKIARKRKHIYNLREKIAEQSHISFYNALQKNDLNVFFKEMKSLHDKYFIANYGSLPVRAMRKVKRLILKTLKMSKLLILIYPFTVLSFIK